MSIVGAFAWLLITRADLAIYIASLQRKLQKPRKKDIKAANVVLGYARREPCGIRYKKIAGPLRVSLASDAAFRAIDIATSGLAMRGYIIVIQSADESGPGGKCCVVDFGARKQKRVCRSTFSAELNALSDAIEHGKMVQLILHQVQVGMLKKPLPSCSRTSVIQENFPSSSSAALMRGQSLKQSGVQTSQNFLWKNP